MENCSSQQEITLKKFKFVNCSRSHAALFPEYFSKLAFITSFYISPQPQCEVINSLIRLSFIVKRILLLKDQCLMHFTGSLTLVLLYIQDQSMDSLTLTANYHTPTKPRSLGGNSTANLKSFRSVVLGKDGVGKSGILKVKYVTF